MAVIRCKMCGGDLLLTEGVTTAQCEYCGSLQTVPQVEQEKKLNLFTRANRLRFGCEFDKAFGVYETIVADYPEEPEAYWGLVLCKYGIEYVDDPLTAKKIPTCHRSSFQSVLEDSNYELTLEYADMEAKRLYRQEAKAIEKLRKEIQEISAKEAPYDIFICYKETAEGTKERTLDSVLGQDLYDALTAGGYRVFFSRVTLEDKVGQEYEPYIFAALNSAKIMLAVGTDYEHFQAVWVKNEWHRFLLLMQENRNKHLIPCYKGIEIEDLPKEFRRLQAQDLGKVGAMQDLLRGIEKLLPRQQTESAATAKSGSGATRFTEQGWSALEERLWSKAKDYFSKLLEREPQNAEACIGLLLAQERRRNLDALTEKWLEEHSIVTPINMDHRNGKERYKPTNFPPAAECYLDRKALEALYTFPQTYTSEIEAWIIQCRQARNHWEQQPLLSQAMECADEEMALRLQKAKDYFLAQMNTQLEEVKGRLQEQENRQRLAYEQQLKKANDTAMAMYQRAKEKLINNYRQMKADVETEQDPYVLSSLARAFERMGNYKEAPALAIRCLERSQAGMEALVRRRKEKVTQKSAELCKLLDKQNRRKKWKLVFAVMGMVLLILMALAWMNWEDWQLDRFFEKKIFTAQVVNDKGWYGSCKIGEHYGNCQM